MILGRPIDFLFGHSTSDNLHKLLILGWKRGRNILDAPHVNLLGGRQEKRRAISGSGQRLWWVRMEIETRSSRSLHQIQLRTPWAPPLLRLSGNGVSATGSAGERPLRKEVTCLQSLSLCDPALNKKADNLLFDLLPWAPCLNYFTPPPQKN